MRTPPEGTVSARAAGRSGIAPGGERRARRPIPIPSLRAARPRDEALRHHLRHLPRRCVGDGDSMVARKMALRLAAVAARRSCAHAGRVVLPGHQRRLRPDAALRRASSRATSAGRWWPTCARCSSARTRRSTRCRRRARRLRRSSHGRRRCRDRAITPGHGEARWAPRLHRRGRALRRRSGLGRLTAVRVFVGGLTADRRDASSPRTWWPSPTGWASRSAALLLLDDLPRLHGALDGGGAPAGRGDGARRCRSSHPVRAHRPRDAGALSVGRAPRTRWATEQLQLLAHKAPYLNVTFFLVRAAIYFVIWILVSQLFSRWSTAPGPERRARASPEGPAARRRRRCPFLGLTLTFAAFDWLMSLDPFWYSTISGRLLLRRQLRLGADRAADRRHVRAESRGCSAALVTRHHAHTWASSCSPSPAFWAYIAFSQFMLIWIANLPEEAAWYLVRMKGGWACVGMLPDRRPLRHPVLHPPVARAEDATRRGLALRGRVDPADALRRSAPGW